MIEMSTEKRLGVEELTVVIRLRYPDSLTQSFIKQQVHDAINSKTRATVVKME